MKTHGVPKLDLLAGVPLFAGLPKRELERIAAVAEELDVGACIDLTAHGRLGHEAFVLLEGGAVVHRDGDVVGTLEPGDFFGELAVLGARRRTATVTTTAPSRVLVFSAQDFRHVVRDLPRIASRMLPEVARRLAAA